MSRRPLRKSFPWSSSARCRSQPPANATGCSSGCQTHSCTVKLFPGALAVKVTESPLSTVLGDSVSFMKCAMGVTVMAKLPV